ncbi:MAG: aspartate/glutamate racemase family protein [Anaerolineaceae bacterium]|nr:aspartate/glutamate racemase family protein [Anaerolineaceae bacterium]
MKTIGLIGGMSWESSLEYYRIINEAIKARLGGFHSAKSILYSVDFAEIESLQRSGRWEEAAGMLAGAAKSLENGGADCVVLCTNTMHKVAEEIETSVNIPFLHIVDTTAQQIKRAGIRKAGLLGTRFTMEEEFYVNRLVQKHGLDILIPDAQGRELVHRVIFDELVLGEIRLPSKERYLDVIAQMVEQGAEGIILGCTEIGLLVHAQDCLVPLFDTARIHAEAAVEFSLGTARQGSPDI